MIGRGSLIVVLLRFLTKSHEMIEDDDRDNADGIPPWVWHAIDRLAQSAELAIPIPKVVASIKQRDK